MLKISKIVFLYYSAFFFSIFETGILLFELQIRTLLISVSHKRFVVEVEVIKTSISAKAITF